MDCRDGRLNFRREPARASLARFKFDPEEGSLD